MPTLPIAQCVPLGEPNPGNSWRKAVALCVCAGYFGAHNYYLGYPRRALVQFIFFIVGLFTLSYGVGLIFLTALALWLIAEFVMISAKVTPYQYDAQPAPLACS
ncbi:NINE protein [Corynebacterium freiburgense]|uniref:NINE protein n=1 Tax=Corynebacterium freiburgense TaxID=556548 RepID=UPI000684E16A|nr:TM2 domain-containing protein [Corynebacterium freiburgense]WJZ02521.1 TM2 domain protein [Corynebacterium freiburgense]